MNSNRITTSTGIVIGGAYCEPPPRQSADADDIQRALLTRCRINRFARAVGAALLATFLLRGKA
ncbi:MAG TPA: hypothetical protein VNU48_03490 [Burkholderiaceae bacterium]|nr:hypothetical protein [Burkholderiaceae bacterium]